MIHQKGKHPLKPKKVKLNGVKRAETLKKKRAVITVELVAESIVESDEKIVQELLDWFRDDVIYVPWVKAVKSVIVKEN